MKHVLILLVGIAALGLSSDINLSREGDPPEPRGTSPRFALCAGMAPELSGTGTPALFRIDQFTGTVWQLQSIPLATGGATAGNVQTWIPTQEMSGDLYQLAMQQIAKRQK